MPEKPSKLLPALYGGIVMAVVSSVPFVNFINCFCCAGVMLGGFLAVFFYIKDLPPAGPPIASSDGIQLGALAGVFGAVIGTVLTVILTLAIGNVAGEAFMSAIIGALGDQLPPEVLDQLETQMAQAGEFSAASTIMSFVGSMVIDPLFGLLGGLIGYNVYKPKAPAAMPPMNQPPAPMG